MKKIFSLAAVSFALLTSTALMAQDGDKSKRPSPPAHVSETIASGAVVSIHYSQPSVKGRTIGKDLEPMTGKVWRTGANEATVFETTKAIKVNGQDLPAGKYALFTIAGDKEWTIIFSKKWEQWGAYDYKEADDALRVNVKTDKSGQFAEKLNFTIDKSGLVYLHWADLHIGFQVQ